MQIQLFQSENSNLVLKIDPRTKLFLLLVTNIVMINGNFDGAAMIYKPILACLPFVLLLTGRRAKAAVGYAIITITAWLIDLYVLSVLSGVLNMILALFSAIFIRWFPCGMMGYYLLSTTRVSEFVAAMQKMHVSQKIIIPLSVMFRFFPTVAEESDAINNAMRMRGIRIRSGKGGIMAMAEYRLIPLMMSIVKIGDELSASALTRGLGGSEKRTNLCRIGFGLWDVFYILLGIAFVTMFIVL